MSDNKKYYWTRTRTDFFESDKIDYMLVRDKGGDYYTLYAILRARCANKNGELYSDLGKKKVPFDTKKIFREAKAYFSEETIEEAMDLFKELELIVLQENGIYRFSDFDYAVGYEVTTQNAENLKRSRSRKKMQAEQTTQPVSEYMSDDNNAGIRCNTEKETDKERDKERDKEIEKDINKDTDLNADINTDKEEVPCGSDSYASCISDVVEYLNLKAGTRFRSDNKQTAAKIRARLKEGYTVEDIKSVIDGKVKEWKGTSMQKYLRPETLFGNKFEGYLNGIRDPYPGLCFRNTTYLDDSLIMQFDDDDDEFM